MGADRVGVGRDSVAMSMGELKGFFGHGHHRTGRLPWPPLLFNILHHRFLSCNFKIESLFLKQVLIFQRHSGCFVKQSL
jgi:hypothetical protein